MCAPRRAVEATRTVIETQSGGGFSRLILFLCCAAMVIEGYDVQVLAYAAPSIIRDWNSSAPISGRSSVRRCSATCWAQPC
jgi:hypothetical protein